MLLPSAEGLSSLVTTVGADRYAFPVARVDEVVRMAWLAPVVDAPPDVLGTLALRGHHVLVIDLLARLGAPPEPLAPSNVLLLVTVRGGQFACRASGVDGLVDAPLRPLGPEAPPQPCVRGLLDLAPPVPLLDVEALLRPELDRLRPEGREAAR